MLLFALENLLEHVGMLSIYGITHYSEKWEQKIAGKSI